MSGRRSPLKSKMWVSTVVLPDESTVGRVPMLVIEGRITPSRIAVVA